MNVEHITKKMAEIGTAQYGTGGTLGRIGAGAVRALTYPIRFLASQSGTKQLAAQSPEAVAKLHPDVWGGENTLNRASYRDVLGARTVAAGEDWNRAPSALEQLFSPSAAAVRQLFADVHEAHPGIAQALRDRVIAHAGVQKGQGREMSPRLQAAEQGGEQRRAFWNKIFGFLTPTTEAGTRANIAKSLRGEVPAQSADEGTQARPEFEVTRMLARVGAAEKKLPAHKQVLPLVRQALLGEQPATPAKRVYSVPAALSPKTAAAFVDLPGAPHPQHVEYAKATLQGMFKPQTAAAFQTSGAAQTMTKPAFELQLQQHHRSDVAKGLHSALAQSPHAMLSPHWQHAATALGVRMPEGFGVHAVTPAKNVLYGASTASRAASGITGAPVAPAAPAAVPASITHRIQQALDQHVPAGGTDAVRKAIQDAHTSALAKHFASHPDVGSFSTMPGHAPAGIAQLYEDLKHMGPEYANSIMHQALSTHESTPSTTVVDTRKSTMMPSAVAAATANLQAAKARRGEAEAAGPAATIKPSPVSVKARNILRPR